MSDPRKFRTNLREVRKERGLTQKELASLIHTSKDTIRRIEREETAAAYEVLFRIAKQFDQPVDGLFWYE